MIFLADHDGHAAVLGDNQPATVLRQLGGDEVFLDQLRGFGRTGDDLLLVKLRTDGRVFFQCSEYLVSNFTVLLFGQTERIASNILISVHPPFCGSHHAGLLRARNLRFQLPLSAVP